MEPASTPPFRVTTRQVALWTLTVLAIVALSVFLFWLRDTVLLFLVGIVVAAALRPVVLRAQRRRIPKSAAVVLTYLVFFGLVVGLGALMLPTIISETMALVEQAPLRYAELKAALGGSSVGLLRLLATRLPSYENLLATAESFLSHVALADVAGSVSSLLTAFVTIMAVAFYWTIDQPRLERLIFSLVRPAERADALTVWRDIESRMGAYLGGTVVVAVLTSIVIGTGYALLGIPYALILAVLHGLGEFVPFVGFILGLVPAVLVAATVSPEKAILVVALNFIVQGIQNTLVWPSIMSRAVGVSPLVLLFALFAFSAIFGPIGAFMAIPLAAIIQVILDYALLHHVSADEETALEAGPLAGVRLRLRELREMLRERMRERDDYLDVESGPDAVDHRIERITDAVERALALAERDPDSVDPAIVEEIARALSQVEALEAEVDDTTSPVGVSADTSAPEASADVDKVIEETKDVLRTAASEIQGAAYEQGNREAQAEADHLEARLEENGAESRRARGQSLSSG